MQRYFVPRDVRKRFAVQVYVYVGSASIYEVNVNGYGVCGDFSQISNFLIQIAKSRGRGREGCAPIYLDVF